MQDLPSISQSAQFSPSLPPGQPMLPIPSCLNYDDSSHIIVLLAFTLSGLSFTLRAAYFSKCRSDSATASAHDTSMASRCFETKGKMPQHVPAWCSTNSSTSLSSLNFCFLSHSLPQPHRPSLCPCSHHVPPFCRLAFHMLFPVHGMPFEKFTLPQP